MTVVPPIPNAPDMLAPELVTTIRSVPEMIIVADVAFIVVPVVDVIVNELAELTLGVVNEANVALRLESITVVVLNCSATPDPRLTADAVTPSLDVPLIAKATVVAALTSVSAPELAMRSA